MDDGGVFEDGDGCLRYKIVRGRFTVLLCPQPLGSFISGRFTVTWLRLSGVPPRSCRKIKAAGEEGIAPASEHAGCIDCLVSSDATMVSSMKVACTGAANSPVSHCLSRCLSCSDSGFQPGCSICSSLSECCHASPTSCSCSASEARDAFDCGESVCSPAVTFSTRSYARCDSGSSSRTKSYGSTASLASFLDDGLFSPAADCGGLSCTLQACPRSDWDGCAATAGAGVASQRLTSAYNGVVSPSKESVLCAAWPSVAAFTGSYPCHQPNSNCSPSPTLTDVSPSHFSPALGLPKRRGRFRIYECAGVAQ